IKSGWPHGVRGTVHPDPCPATDNGARIANASTHDSVVRQRRSIRHSLNPSILPGTPLLRRGFGAFFGASARKHVRHRVVALVAGELVHPLVRPDKGGLTPERPGPTGPILDRGAVI